MTERKGREGMARMTLDDKLGLDRFHTDENNPHIHIDEEFADAQELERLVMACPAGLYETVDGRLRFNFEGCLECGTCRILSGGRAVRSWEYPRGSKGVHFAKG
ncbi:MAG: 4Fe-4S dicluster domain-containing protein [Clostridiales Family XIII bacterium]|jgi:ferredoxin like protein|nr:4Fe-4S dicluster domain-containing protein [Clostridiales Family XIII bacterium]